MAAIFPKWSNRVTLALIVSGVLGASGVVAGMWYYFTPKYTRVGYKPIQPVGFPHSTHGFGGHLQNVDLLLIIQQINRDLGVTILLVEQNARAALSVASHGYIMEQGKVVLDGSADELRDNEDVKEFYLGGAGDQRKSFKNLKSFKRRKRWL